MKKVTVSDPVILAQSTTEPVMFGGYQDPHIRQKDGVLYIRFNARRDSVETFGLEDANPVYKSLDGGDTWVKAEQDDWMLARQPLPNGDIFEIREHRPIFNVWDKIKDVKLDPSRKGISAIGEAYDAYLVDELAPLFDGELTKTVNCKRIYAGTNEIVEETCTINWKNMPVRYTRGMIRRDSIGYSVDADGVLWGYYEGPYILDDGTAGSRRLCSHILRSDDFGHTWNYVNTLVYKEEYNKPNSKDIEGFNETEFIYPDDGSIMGIVRAGSLFPLPGPKMGDKDHPAPYMYYFKTTDKFKSFDFIKPFYDYGVCPRAVKLGCGTFVLISGRPGIYIRTCDDPAGEKWDDIIEILHVPEDEVYEEYWKYTCSNTGICAIDDNTAIFVYADFTLPDENGVRAKSIVVRKVTIE